MFRLARRGRGFDNVRYLWSQTRGVPCVYPRRRSVCAGATCIRVMTLLRVRVRFSEASAKWSTDTAILPRFTLAQTVARAYRRTRCLTLPPRSIFSNVRAKISLPFHMILPVPTFLDRPAHRGGSFASSLNLDHARTSQLQSWRSQSWRALQTTVTTFGVAGAAHPTGRSAREAKARGGVGAYRTKMKSRSLAGWWHGKQVLCSAASGTIEHRYGLSQRSTLLAQRKSVDPPMN